MAVSSKREHVECYDKLDSKTVQWKDLCNKSGRRTFGWVILQPSTSFTLLHIIHNNMTFLRLVQRDIITDAKCLMYLLFFLFLIKTLIQLEREINPINYSLIWTLGQSGHASSTCNWGMLCTKVNLIWTHIRQTCTCYCETWVSQ